MASKKHTQPTEFRISVREEEALLRLGLSGEASLREAQEIKRLRERYAGSQLPVLVADDGLTRIDTVFYGALVQWAQAVRNRNVGWVLVTSVATAGRMFQMAGINPRELIYASEDAARKALDRGRPGQRVSPIAPGSLALDGLRGK